LYHLGPCGNLSPRYHVKAQTFPEAEKLGNRLGECILAALKTLEAKDFQENPPLAANRTYVELPPNRFQPVEAAREKLRETKVEFERLKAAGADHGPVRTAECAVFGAEEALTLASAQAAGELAEWQKRYGHAEVQALRVGESYIAAWPGEQFVEYGLELKRRAGGRVFVVSLANGELQGYIVTPQAAAAGGYEAAFALFKPESGAQLIEAGLGLISAMK
jgi:hypothetical protein